jgi:hypothetical protein
VGKAVCQKCHWTSGDREAQDEADGMGKFHEQDAAGHTVVITEVPDPPRQMPPAGSGTGRSE